MTNHSDHHDDGRVCVRGCLVPDAHFAKCDSFGLDDGPCSGCVPRAARPGVLVCERCYRALRRMLDDAPDMIAHLRSIADPTKARIYERDRVATSRPEMPAPVDASLIDASNDIALTLRSWALRVEDPRGEVKARHLEAGIGAAPAFDDARVCADIVLEDLDRIANDRDQVLALSKAVLSQSASTSPDFWSLTDVASRWSLEDRPRWAETPCPDCDLKTVKVIPSRRRGGRTRYICRTKDCRWEADDRDDDGLWADVFSRPEPIPLGAGVAHDPRWLTLTAAARVVGRTTSTVRRWADNELVKTDAGRYWQPDVEAAAGAQVGGAA